MEEDIVVNLGNMRFRTQLRLDQDDQMMGRFIKLERFDKMKIKEYLKLTSLYFLWWRGLRGNMDGEPWIVSYQWGQAVKRWMKRTKIFISRNL